MVNRDKSDFTEKCLRLREQENDFVIYGIINQPEKPEFEVTGWLNVTNTRGDDIVAVRDGVELRIEAKGEGSSQPHTARFGKTFTKNQVKDHVAHAFFRVANIRENKKSLVGIALPDNFDHREMISRIENTINDLGIILFWVSEDLQVSVDGANKSVLVADAIR